MGKDINVGFANINAKAMLAPYPSEDMICWSVSQRLGNVENNDTSLIEPIVLPSASGDAHWGVWRYTEFDSRIGSHRTNA